MRSLLQTAGFRVVRRFPEAFVQTVVCEATDVGFAHRMPNETEARAMGREVSLQQGSPGG